MCRCKTPTMNGEYGYSWDGKEIGVREPSPPDLGPDDVLLYDAPGRCGRGTDAHCHHYRIVKCFGSTMLLVKHGAGEERIYLSAAGVTSLSVLNNEDRFWIINTFYHAIKRMERETLDKADGNWRQAAAEKRIKVRKIRGQDRCRVTIEQRKNA